MKFVDVLLGWLKTIVSFIADGFNKLMHFLAKPLSYLFYFLDGIFYFITVLFDVIVKVIMIFVSLFQFFFSLVVGFLRTIVDFLTPSFGNKPHMPSSSGEGLQVLKHVLDPVGFLNVIPYIGLALVWSAFVMKMFALLGGGTSVKGGE